MFDGAIVSVRSRARRWNRALVGVQVVVVLGVVLLNLLQQPGRTTFDTKLDLQLDAVGFLSRSTYLWNPDWALGGLQNQASGYLFPMGPVFALGDLLGSPMWVWQRLWSALVMLVAYEGARRLAARWPGIGTAGAVLAGLTYMLSPRVLTTVGGLSGETLPAAVLPWTVLPLALYLLGRMRGWVAFVLSAATVPLMGGQNATLVVACLVLPGLLLALASGRTVRRRAGDLAGWGSLVVLACLWWLVPLVLLGSYAPPFLDYIESADNTAGATGWLTSLRGTSHWVAFFPGGGSVGWSGGYELASSGVLLVSTVLVAAAGLAGLLQPSLWQRRALATSVLVGLVVLTAGTGGWAGSAFSGQWLDALDTWLAPLRNIHKFDPVVRLPLSLGVGAWVTTALPVWWSRSTASWSLPARRLSVAVTGVLVVLACAPAAGGSLRIDDGFDEVPAGWREAVAYLREQPSPTRVLVLPGAGFAVQDWGRTIDEPIQVLDPPPWLARAQVTVAPAGTLRLLDTLEQSVAEARPQERVEETLRELGVTHVVVRNDLDLEETDAPAPDVVRATVGRIPGSRIAAAFGDGPGGGPAVVVYALDTDDDPRVDLQDWDGRAVVDGGPEVVPDLRAAGLVGAHQAVELATEGEQPDLVTDSLRRVERSFGRVHDARSGVMTAEDDYRVSRREHDYSDRFMPTGRTTAVYDGASDILASSSVGYADVLGPVRPEQHPYSAFDHSLYTAWVTAPLSRPQGQWVEVRFDEPAEIGQVSLSFDTFSGARVTSVRVETDDHSAVADVEADGTVPGLDLDDESATRLRITVLGAAGDSGQVRLSDVRIADHDITRSFALPGHVGADTGVYLSSEAPRRACAVQDDGVVTCELSRQRETSETPGFDRTITVDESGTWRVGGRAAATNGPGVDRLFAPLDGKLVSVLASSTFAGDPAVTAAGAFDGLIDSGWTSAPGDPAATLQLHWGPRRRVSGIDVSLSSDQPGVLPETVIVDGGPGTGDPQLVATAGPGAGEMRPVRTRQLRITAYGEAGPEGFGISELGVSGIEDLRFQPEARTPTGAACGFGPTVEVAGQVVQTRLSGTLDDVRSGAGLAVVPCGVNRVRLAPGEHRVRVTNPDGFAVTSLWLVPATAAPTDPAPQPEITAWSPTDRSVEVDARSTSVLGVSESYNRGWDATFHGVELAPVVLDGWRQGFVLPAGTTGTVVLRYGPQTAFGVALWSGLALVGLLLLLAVGLLVARVGGRAVADPDDGSVPAVADAPSGVVARVLALVALVALAVVSLPLLVGVVLGASTLRRHALHVAAVVAGALVFSAVIALSASSVVVPPVGSDVVAALAVGIVCGRVLVRP